MKATSETLAYNRHQPYPRKTWQSIQSRLNVLGKCCRVDGLPGPETARALADWQTQYRMRSKDGKCGAATMLSLGLGLGAFKSTYLREEMRSSPDREYGIDVSYWQGKIDWKLVGEAGVIFTFIRVLQNSKKGVVVDKYALDNATGAGDNGIEWSGYVPVKIKGDHRRYSDQLLELCEGSDMAPAVDLEYKAVRKAVDTLGRVSTLEWLHDICQDVRDERADVVVYGSKRSWDALRCPSGMGPSILWEVDYVSREYEARGKLANTQYRQWTSIGRCPGIGGNVDLNVRY